MAMFYVDMEKRYLSFWNGKEDILEALYRDFYLSEDIGCRNFAQALIWPMWAKNKSFDLLTNYGPMQYASIGVNHILEDALRKHSNSNALEFEFVVNSPAIHIATALQATYFPFLQKGKQGHYSDEGVAGILGQILNMYQYAKANQQKNISEYADILSQQKLAINMLNVENNVDINNILYYSEKYKTAQTLKNILNNLSQMDIEKRQAQIYEYNNLIAEIGKERITPEKGMDYILTAAGFNPEIGGIISILSAILQVAKPIIKNRREKDIIERLANEKSNLKDEVYLLDKLNRVAKIKVQQ